LCASPELDLPIWQEISSQLGLDREKLIALAMLLGSDYTQGVYGIGIVNAIEVVNAFPGVEGLREFRDWVYSGTDCAWDHHCDLLLILV